ncbi:[NiFe]-hydrogenase assembly chaperone HybE [Bradyrhizobium sp.]|uniref:[NiFe]-hydrogenase assembly chaperone HybE n=1 Tax=Bradyrhizobium sp. TaxID=376 RepID=UPI0040378304
MKPDGAPHRSSRVDGDPVAWGDMLAAVYRDVGERQMRDLPIFNEALGVEAIGFRRFDGHVVGIMVTPWFMNVVVDADDCVLQAHRPGSTFCLRFPAGNIEFTVGEVASVGRVASCSLFSPMFEFADKASALATAAAALDALMLPPSESERDHAATGTIDRRAFLRGTLTERRA